MSEKIGLLGSGGQADEAAAFSTKKEVVFRAVSKEYLGGHADVDISNPSEDAKDTPVLIAVGAPAVRRMLESQWPGEKYETITSEHAIVDSSASIAEGCLIAPRAVITTNVEIGAHTIVNVAASIQHDTKVGSFVTIGPGVNIGGNVTIGDGVFIGIGANVINNINIADGVVLGAGSTLIEDAETENGVYVGSPAKLIRQQDDWLREI